MLRDGLRTALRPSSGAAPAAPAATSVEFAVRTALGAGRALPAGCETYYLQAATVYGIYTVGVDPAEVHFPWSDTDGPAGGAGGTDPRLDGFVYTAGGTPEMRVLAPNGNYTLELCMGRFSSPGNFHYRVANLAGGIIIDHAGASVAAGHCVDATGQDLSVANFFAAQVATPFAMTDGGCTLEAWGGGDSLALSWVRLTKV